MADEYDVNNLMDLGPIDLDGFLGNPLEGSFSLPSLSPPLLDPEPSKDNSQEDVKQTGLAVETSVFPGNYNFRVQIAESSSKNYIFSEKLKRLYCIMDKAVPMKFFWEGPRMFDVRALLIFQEPDEANKPVYRCRAHNDKTHSSNQDCAYYRHVLRCDSQSAIYKENVQSLRHSVVTSFDNDQNADGVQGIYRFMCATTCNGVGAIARRRTNLVITLEDNGHVVGRVVVGVKICCCPLRDKRRDEADDGSGRKRKSQENDADSRKVKKENCTSTNDGSNANIKQEVMTDAPAGEYVNLQIEVPNFPAGKIQELTSFVRRIVASFYASEEDISSVTRNVHINQV